MDLLLALDQTGAHLVQREDGGLRVIGGHVDGAMLAALRQHKGALLAYMAEGRPLTRHDAIVRLLVLCTALDLDDVLVRALPEPDIAACLGLPDAVLVFDVEQLAARARAFAEPGGGKNPFDIAPDTARPVKFLQPRN